MELPKKKYNTNYNRVMSRVHNNSQSTLRSSASVTRHEIPSSNRIGAKPSVSNTAVFTDLPTVLNDYIPDIPIEKKSVIVKPRKTIRSLNPGRSPPRTQIKPQELNDKPRNIRVPCSAPTLMTSARDRWSDRHVRECFSSRSHTKLKELKEEIKAYHNTDKLMKLRSKVYKKCGVILDDVGCVAEDKAVQAEIDSQTELR